MSASECSLGESENDSGGEAARAERRYDYSISDASSFTEAADAAYSHRPSAASGMFVGAPRAAAAAAARLGGISGDRARHTRELGALQLTYERQISRLRARAREDAHEARARERQLRKALRARTEQLDVLKLDLTTVVQRLEESEEHAHALHAALQEHRAEVGALREQLADRDRRLAASEAHERSLVVELSTAQAELRSALESGGVAQQSGDDARMQRDGALAALAELREQRRRAGTHFLRLAANRRLSVGFGRWAFHARLIVGAAMDGDVAQLRRDAHDAALRLDEVARARASAEASRDELRRVASQLAGISRLGTARADVLGRADASVHLALLRWHRTARTSARALGAWASLAGALTDGARKRRAHAQSERWARYARRRLARDRRLVLTGERALSALLVRWRLLAQGRQLSAHCAALEAQGQNLTAAHTGAWWAAEV
ncbi:hypothetical protein KFE25_010285 [Diacronema lutheri]|uniref:Uncharacterized protein n=1 Tax=Diacronema lutheri TaxID=2081491 RepID=A0A8J5XNJ0_DIALT|nr:hypothetical protein KFE25_010285 [Diacronema lutheri]